MCPCYFEMEMTKKIAWTDLSGMKNEGKNNIYSGKPNNCEASRRNHYSHMQPSAMSSDVLRCVIYVLRHSDTFPQMCFYDMSSV